MRGKLLFITGGMIGYVLGARAGRKRYDQIAAAATDLWNAPPVQRRVTEVRDFALEAVGDVPSQLFDAGKKVYATVQDKTGRGKAGRSSATTSAARTAAAEKVAQGNEPAAQATAQATAEARARKRAAKAGGSTPTSPASTASDAAEPTAN